MVAEYIYLVRMGIRPDLEGEFNEVYDNEHIPALQSVQGVGLVVRYVRHRPAARYYLALYELDDPEIPSSREWREVGELGRWASQIRPFTTERVLTRYKLMGGSPPTGGGRWLWLVEVHPRAKTELPTCLSHFLDAAAALVTLDCAAWYGKLGGPGDLAILETNRGELLRGSIPHLAEDLRLCLCDYASVSDELYERRARGANVTR